MKKRRNTAPTKKAWQRNKPFKIPKEMWLDLEQAKTNYPHSLHFRAVALVIAHAYDLRERDLEDAGVVRPLTEKERRLFETNYRTEIALAQEGEPQEKAAANLNLRQSDTITNRELAERELARTQKLANPPPQNTTTEIREQRRNDPNAEIIEHVPIEEKEKP